jgi:hypothetical protein
MNTEAHTIEDESKEAMTINYQTDCQTVRRDLQAGSETEQVVLKKGLERM